MKTVSLTRSLYLPYLAVIKLVLLTSVRAKHPTDALPKDTSDFDYLFNTSPFKTDIHFESSYGFFLVLFIVIWAVISLFLAYIHREWHFINPESRFKMLKTELISTFLPFTDISKEASKQIIAEEFFDEADQDWHNRIKKRIEEDKETALYLVEHDDRLKDRIKNKGFKINEVVGFVNENRNFKKNSSSGKEPSNGAFPAMPPKKSKNSTDFDSMREIFDAELRNLQESKRISRNTMILKENSSKPETSSRLALKDSVREETNGPVESSAKLNGGSKIIHVKSVSSRESSYFDEDINEMNENNELYEFKQSNSLIRDKNLLQC